MAGNNRGPRRRTRQQRSGQTVNQLLSALASLNLGKSKRNKKRTTRRPLYPLAREGDLRLTMGAADAELALRAISNAWKQGGGHASLSDSGRVNFAIDFSLPTPVTVRLIRTAENNSSTN
ncbi:N protein [Lopma virus]|nr:N protein [Lopma virus]